MSLGINLFPTIVTSVRKKKNCQRKSTNLPPIDIKDNRGNHQRSCRVKKRWRCSRDIRDVDLLAKELQVHDKCRLHYTRKCDSIENGDKDVETFGNFDAVKNVSEDHVLKNNQAAPMSLIHDLYADDHDGIWYIAVNWNEKLLKLSLRSFYFLPLMVKIPRLSWAVKVFIQRIWWDAMRHYCKRQLNIYKAKF